MPEVELDRACASPFSLQDTRFSELFRSLGLLYGQKISQGEKPLFHRCITKTQAEIRFFGSTPGSHRVSSQHFNAFQKFLALKWLSHKKISSHQASHLPCSRIVIRGKDHNRHLIEVSVCP